MIIEQLISPMVPTLTPVDTGSRALFLMEENGLAHLPLISEDQYLALISESALLDWDAPDAALKTADSLDYKPAVFATAHPYDALRVAHQHNLSIVPIIDNTNKYLGAITRDDLLKYIAETSGLDNPGAIIVLELEPRNYTLYEIARIFENEEAVIISTQLYTNRETGKLEMTIKTNRNDLQGVVSSLERYNYKVKQVYGETANNEDIDSRYNLLMTYINM